MHAKSLQSCPTLRDPMDLRPPGSSAHVILPERRLEWVAMSFSKGSPWPRDWTQVSYISGTGREVIYALHHLRSPNTHSIIITIQKLQNV